MDAFIGTILPVAFNFAPVGWMKCEGQILSIAQNQALFSVLGTMYGGNGTTTFALPDLRGRTLVGAGQSGGMSPVIQGDMFGAESATVTVNGAASVTIDAAHLPKHTHPVNIASSQLNATSTLYATSAGPGSPAPAEGTALGSSGTGPGSAAIYVGNSAAPTVALNASSVTTKLADVSATAGENGGGAGTFSAPVAAAGTTSLVQPSLGMNYIICVNGLYPSRG